MQAATLLLLLLYVVWMLHLPSFPTTDGPMHMYYVHVLGALLSHKPSPYTHFFRIRHLFPPYAFYYYALLGLSRFVPMLLADRLIICLYFISFVFGFRFLARAVGPAADLMTLLATLLLVNWPLGMGFVNFCLSLSFSFWALGIWLRILGTRALWGRVGFLALVTAIMFTHPVPLLLLLAVSASVLLVRFAQARRPHAGGRLPAHWRADLLTWALAALNLGYVKLFATANPLQQVEPSQGYWLDVTGRVHNYALERALAVMEGARWDFYSYRVALALVLLVPLVMALRQRMRNRRAGVWTVGDTLLLLGVLLLIALPLFPSQLNGLYFFADRLMLCIWLAPLLAASGWSARRAGDDLAPVAGGQGQRLSPGARFPASAPVAAVVCIVFSLSSSLILLHGLNDLLRVPARVIAHLGDGIAVPQQAMAFVLEDGRKRTLRAPLNLDWNPFFWAGVHVLRRNDDVMSSAPWMDESIIPITNTAALPQVTLPVLQRSHPDQMEKTLLQTPDQLAGVLAVDDLFIVNQEARPPQPPGTEPLLGQAYRSGMGWTCAPVGEGNFRICRKHRSPP